MGINHNILQHCVNKHIILFFYTYVLIHMQLVHLDIFTLFFQLHEYHWYLILFYWIWSCSYLQIGNMYFYHLEVSLFIITHVMMITTTYQSQHHQLLHKLIQQNFIQLTKHQSMILYKKFLQKNKIIKYKYLCTR